MLVDGPAWDEEHTDRHCVAIARRNWHCHDDKYHTISGSFGITLTVTATTSLTLPTSGTILAASGLTDNALLRANGTAAVQGSDAILDDSENLSAIGNITGKVRASQLRRTGSGGDIRLTDPSATKGTVTLGSATTTFC
jgi:hypothetical protein